MFKQVKINKHIVIFGTLIIIVFFLEGINAQVMMQRGWTELAEKNDLHISFIFYSEADNYNNGVVLKLENSINKKISYSFDLIFRSPGTDKIEHVAGELQALQVKAGSNDSLFWIPFEDGKFISEVGIKNISVMIIKEKSD